MASISWRRGLLPSNPLQKVLIEKMLRTSPGIGKIYVFVKANDEEHALHRVISEVRSIPPVRKASLLSKRNLMQQMSPSLAHATGLIVEAALATTLPCLPTVACVKGATTISSTSSIFSCYKECAIDLDCPNLGMTPSNESTPPPPNLPDNGCSVLRGRYHWLIPLMVVLSILRWT